MYKTSDNLWRGSIELEGAEQLTVDVEGPQQQNTTRPGNTQFELGFSPDGRLSYVSDGIDTNNQGEINANISFRLPGNPALKVIQLRLGMANQVDGVTQFSSQFTTKAVEQDGKTMGYLESFDIDASGTITGVFSNGAREPLARIALANFTNPEGLMKKGSNNFQETNNSGTALVGEAGIEGKGEVNSGMLEIWQNSSQI